MEDTVPPGVYIKVVAQLGLQQGPTHPGVKSGYGILRTPGLIKAVQNNP
jgi:hypothetical protein